MANYCVTGSALCYTNGRWSLHLTSQVPANQVRTYPSFSSMKWPGVFLLFSGWDASRVLPKMGSRGRTVGSRWWTVLIKRRAVVLSGPHGGWGPPFIGGSRSLSEKILKLGKLLKSAFHCNYFNWTIMVLSSFLKEKEFQVCLSSTI